MFITLFLIPLVDSQSVSPLSDVSRLLLLLGVCHHLSVCGRLRLHRDPRDQKQDLHGDQPNVLQEGGGLRDPGPAPCGPAEAEEDERLRRSGAHVTGVRQLILCTLTEPQLLKLTSNHSSLPLVHSYIVH